MKANGSRVAIDLVLGAIAGTVGMWAMGKATSYMYDRESRQARELENHAREGKTAYGVAAEKAAGLAGRELSAEQRESYGSRIHRALGIAAGAAYGGLRHRIPAADAGAGSLLGTTMWLLLDEATTPMLGLTPGPAAFPWQTHARGLVGHLVFGVVTEALLTGVDRLR